MSDDLKQRAVDLISGRAVGFRQDSVERFVSIGEAVEVTETDTETIIYFSYALLDPNIVEDPSLSVGALESPRFYRAPSSVSNVIKSRAIKIYNAARSGYVSDEPTPTDALMFTDGERMVLSDYRYQIMIL